MSLESKEVGNKFAKEKCRIPSLQRGAKGSDWATKKCSYTE